METLLDLALEAGPRRARQRSESKIEAEALVLLPDEVERGEAVLSFHQPQAAAQLLEEDGRALGRSKEEDGVDLRNVHAPVEQVHREQDVDLPRAKLPEGVGAIVAGGIG